MPLPVKNCEKQSWQPQTKKGLFVRVLFGKMDGFFIKD
jgi:hypothetical protein